MNEIDTLLSVHFAVHQYGYERYKVAKFFLVSIWNLADLYTLPVLFIISATALSNIT